MVKRKKQYDEWSNLELGTEEWKKKLKKKEAPNLNYGKILKRFKNMEWDERKEYIKENPQTVNDMIFFLVGYSGYFEDEYFKEMKKTHTVKRKPKDDIDF